MAIGFFEINLIRTGVHRLLASNPPPSDEMVAWLQAIPGADFSSASLVRQPQGTPLNLPGLTSLLDVYANPSRLDVSAHSVRRRAAIRLVIVMAVQEWASTHILQTEEHLYLDSRILVHLLSQEFGQLVGWKFIQLTKTTALGEKIFKAFSLTLLCGILDNLGSSPWPRATCRAASYPLQQYVTTPLGLTNESTNPIGLMALSLFLLLLLQTAWGYYQAEWNGPVTTGRRHEQMLRQRQAPDARRDSDDRSASTQLGG